MIIPVLFGVSVVIFFTLRVIPGDVAQTILGTSATEESLAALRNKFGLNMPLYEQYFTWMSGVLVGDFRCIHADWGRNSAGNFKPLCDHV